MSALTSLPSHVERYLAERHRLGFSTRSDIYVLRSLARHVQAVGHRGALTLEIITEWARGDSHAPLGSDRKKLLDVKWMPG